MGNFEDRLSQLQQNEVSDAGGRTWGAGTYRSDEPRKKALRELALRRYMEAEQGSYSPELHGPNPADVDYLRGLWDQVHPDDQRSLMGEQDYRRYMQQDVIPKLMKDR